MKRKQIRRKLSNYSKIITSLSLTALIFFSINQSYNSLSLFLILIFFIILVFAIMVEFNKKINEKFCSFIWKKINKIK